jgi:guanylate kinase
VTRGTLLVLAGPSGVGKGTIGKALLGDLANLRWSVSWTTRAPRDGEVDGRDYHFVTRERFEVLRAEGGFLESFEVYGDLKGTPLGPVVGYLDDGHDVLVEVDVQGALAIRRQFPEALLVFVRPPSREAQSERIRGRNTDSPEAIARRLDEAEREERIAEAEFDAIVVNDDLKQAVAAVAAILAARRGSDP